MRTGGVAQERSLLPEEKARRFLEVAVWLDNAVWDSPRDPISNPLYENLEPAERILVHWLCYITNRQRPAREVWEEGGLVFASLVGDYGNDSGASQNLDELLAQHQKPGKGSLSSYCASDDSKEVSYTPRYGRDQESIERTLTILVDFDRSLAQFIRHFVLRFGNASDGLKRLAHALDILSYRLKTPSEKARLLLGSESGLSKNYEVWLRSSTNGHKRLWAALRDYRKPESPFFAYLETVIAWPPTGFELDQLELPGDVWNNRFAERLLKPIASSLGLEIKGKASPHVARQLYDRSRELMPDTEFYPARLDFSFSFAPRMCEQDMCDVCMFGENSRRLCPGERPEAHRMLCPLILLACGCRYSCDVTKCPVAEGVSHRLCDVYS